MYVLKKTNVSFTQSFASGSIVKKGRKKKQLLSATTVKTHKLPGKIKKMHLWKISETNIATPTHLLDLKNDLDH